ncbi:MAG TPA: hypothetical protein DDY37_03225 [Legionella sp.]|nr:hypothetical protein [Legionella sp.]
MLFMNEFPPVLTNRYKPLDASHSTEESRKQQVKSCSQTILALDLAADDHSMGVITNQLSMPIGIPSSWDRAAFYQIVVRAAVSAIARNNTMNTRTSSADLLNLMRTQEIPGLTTSIESIQKYHPKRQEREFAFRIWFQGVRELTSRVLLLCIEKNHISHDEREVVQSFQSIFGNVDVFIIPDTLILSGDEKELRFIDKLSSNAGELNQNAIVSISHYLDHGQLLNLAKLKKWGWKNLDLNKGFAASSPYHHHLNEFSYYEETSPNGFLMQNTLPDKPFFLHATEYKQAIMDSQSLNVSRAGCLGNMIYTTVLMGDESDIVGGHAIGLYKRKYDLAELNKNKFICFQAINNQNNLTNWIEKLGRGRIFLEARHKIMTSKPYGSPFFIRSMHYEKIQSITNDVIPQYRKLYPLLLLLTTNRSPTNNTTDRSPLFSMATHIMEKIYNGPDGVFNSVLNGIFFEIIKDFILLFLNDEDEMKFSKLNSYNMIAQDAIFFELFPRLIDDWNTGFFPIKMSRVMEILGEKGLMNNEDKKRVFKNFFVDRLFYYINLGCLEGAQDIPHPAQIRTFDDLANRLPNLAGLIHYDLIKSSTDVRLRDDYNHAIRCCYDTSYDERNIDLAVKCGISATEETGVRSRTRVRFFDFDFFKREHGFYQVHLKEDIPVSITGLSEKNGFSIRFNETKP